MADLGNSKIKDTYTLVLQTDSSGNLQKLDGTTPSPFIVNGNLRYVDGNQALNYVLTSDASGNASWSEAGGTSYWSANTDGTISNSGFTNVGIGTPTPNKPLTVVGDISGTTDLYLGTSTYTGSTITAEEALIIKGRGVDNDYLRLSQDLLQFYLDGTEFATFTSLTHPSAAAGMLFNASSQDYDFTIKGDDTTPIFQVYGESGGNRIRIRDHLTIGANEAVSHAEMVTWGLAVTGSSLFYSGATLGTYPTAITAVGDISGTTDLYIGLNMYSGTTNLLDIFTHGDANNYWTGNTDGSISPSGETTTVKTEGDVIVSGTIKTVKVTTTGGTSADTLTIEAGTVNIRNQDGITEYLKIAPNGFTFFINDTEAINFTDDSKKYYFDGRPGSATDWYLFEFQGDNGYPVLQMNPEWELARFKDHVAIGATYGTWPNINALTYGLFVSGSSIFHSGGTAGSEYPYAIEASGHISGTTDLHIGKDINVGNDIYWVDNGMAIFGAGSDLKIYHSGSHSIIQDAGAGDLQIKGSAVKIRGTSVSEDCAVFTENAGVELYYDNVKRFETTTTGVSALTSTVAGNLNVSGNTFYEGALSGTGNITTVGNLDVDGTTNLDNTDIDGTFAVDGTTISLDATTSLNIDNTNTTNGVTINTVTSGSKVFIGHTTSETTVNDNLTVTGKITRNFVPSGVDVGDFNGDVIHIGDEIVTTAGALYQLSDGAAWELAVADAVPTSTKLLGIALGSDSTSGFLVRGTVTMASSTGGSDGDVLYVSTTDGRVTSTAPTASGAVVRAVGYVLAEASNPKIWFNPDNTWVELS